MSGTWSKRTAGVLAGVTLLATACGRTGGEAAGPVITEPTRPVPESRGWLEGDDLDWAVVGGEGGVAFADGGAVAPESEAATAGGDAAPAFDAADEARIDPDVTPVPPDSGPPSAGSIDDNATFADYLAYRDRIVGQGIEVRPLDVSGRIVVDVVDAGGRPVHDALVVATTAGGATTSVRTDTAGRAYVLPRTAGGGDVVSLVASQGDATAEAVPQDGAATLTIPVEVPAPAPELELVFLLDATGSMDDEIAQLRTTISSIAERMGSLDGSPSVRLGMTVYRDQGDLFLNRTYDLTADVGAFSAALDDVVADGGGDYPEALDEALAAALDGPAWSEPRPGVVQMVVLLADAPPQVGRQVGQPYTASALEAAARGVKVFPVAASGTDDQAEYVFREIAEVTGGRFVFLSYGQEGTATGDATSIGPDDFAELPLDDLVVALVAHELEPLTAGQGGGTTPPPTTAPPTTSTTIYEQ